MPNRRGFTRTQAEVAAMRQKIATDTATAINVLRAIYHRQTIAEQFKQQHSGEHDGWGFQPHQTTPLCRLYERLEERSWLVYPHEADGVRARMIPYAEQYIDHEEQRAREDALSARQRA